VESGRGLPQSKTSRNYSAGFPMSDLLEQSGSVPSPASLDFFIGSFKFCLPIFFWCVNVRSTSVGDRRIKEVKHSQLYDTTTLGGG
jgi:hypothetical protein